MAATTMTISKPMRNDGSIDMPVATLFVLAQKPLARVSMVAPGDSIVFDNDLNFPMDATLNILEARRI